MNEKEALKKMIDQRLNGKCQIAADAERTDNEVKDALLDICILNKLRDANGQLSDE